MKKTITTFLFLFAISFFASKNVAAQTACNYTFTYTISGTTVTFNNTPNVSLGGVIPNTISWTWDTLNFSNTNDPTYTGATIGYHIVCMIVVDFSCANTPNGPTFLVCDTVYISGQNGINEKDLAKSINVFPNPSNGKVNVNSALSKVENISVYNVLGALVKEEKETTFNNEVDLSTLTNGIYIIKVKTEAGVITKKITINK